MVLTLTNSVTPSVSPALEVQRTRSNSLDVALNQLREQRLREEKKAHFSLWLLSRSYFKHTPAQQDCIKEFDRSLQAALTEFWTAIKGISSDLVQPIRPVSVLEKCVQAALIFIPNVGSMIKQAEDSVMQERYINGFKILSTKLSTYGSIDSITRELSARIIAYYQSHILNSEWNFESSIFQPLIDIFSPIIDPVLNTLLNKPDIAINEGQRTLFKVIFAKLLLALEDFNSYQQVEEHNLAACLSQLIDIYDVRPQGLDKIPTDEAGLVRVSRSLLHLCRLANEPTGKMKEYADRWGYSRTNSSTAQGVASLYLHPNHMMLSFHCQDLEKWFTSLAKQGVKSLYEDALKPLLEPLKQVIEQRLKDPNQSLPPLWCTGHSIGGALATLAAAKLKEAYPALPVMLVTFGAPPSLKTPSPKLDAVNRWVSAADRVPGLSFGFIHPEEKERTLPHLQESFFEKPVMIFPKHSLNHYQQALMGYARSEGIEFETDINWNEFDRQSQQSMEQSAQEEAFYKQIQELPIIRTANKSHQVTFLQQSFADSPIRPSSQICDNENDNAFALVHIDTMKEQLTKGLLAELRKTNQKLTALLTTRERLTLAYPVAKGLETVILHEHFGLLDPPLKAEFLANYNRCLIMGLVQSGGKKYEMDANILAKWDRCILSNEANAFLHAEHIVTKALIQLRQADRQEMMRWASQMHQLTVTLDEEKLDLSPSLLKYKIPLLYALSFFGIGKKLPVIEWIQKELKNHRSSPEERFISLYYLVCAAKTASLFESEQILLGAEERIGLRDWLTERDERDVQLILHLCQHRQEPLWQEMRGAQHPTFSLRHTLRILAEKSAPQSQEKIHDLLLYQRLQKLENTTLQWSDYCELGKAFETTDPEFAFSSYQHALELAKKASADSSGVINHLSALHVKQGKKFIGEGKKIEGLRHLLQALSMWDENITDDMLQNHTLQVLYKTCLPNNDIAERLLKVMRPLGVGEKEKELLAQGHTIVKTLFSGTGVLSKEAVDQLYENDHLRIANYRAGTSTVKQGRHNVAQIGAASQQLHLKENPASPGLALGAWSLYQLSYGLTGEAKPGLVPIEPLKVERIYKGKPQTYYLQASPTIYGTNLNELRKRTFTPQKSQLSAMIVASMLLDLEDGRDDNFMFSNDGHIIGIDNDHVWVKEDVEKGITGSITPKVKNILYCFPEMQEEIDPTLRVQLTSDAFSPIEMLKLWLYTLLYYNKAVETVYSPDERKKLFERPKEDEKMILEAYFYPEALGRLYLKWSLLRRALRDQECKTHMDLLKAVQPRVGDIYGKAFLKTSLIDPFQRFDSVTPGCFTSQGGTKTTNAQLVQLILA